MTAVADKPNRKKAEKSANPPAWKEPDRLPQTAESLEAALVDAQAEQRRLDEEYIYPGDKAYDRHCADKAAVKAAIADLESRIELARTKALPAAPAMAATKQFEVREIPLNQIVITGNHRDTDDVVADERLVRSLQAHSLHQPIGVRIAGIGAYELIFGSRRRRAAMAAGWTDILAKVYPEHLTPLEVEILRTIENFGRKDLTSVERVIAIARCLDEVHKALEPAAKYFSDRIGPQGPEQAEKLFAAAAAISLDQVSTDVNDFVRVSVALAQSVGAAGGIDAYVGHQLGYEAVWVKDHSYVARLGGETRRLLAAGRITLAHARELAKLGDPAVCDHIAADVARNDKGTGGATAEETRKRVTEKLKSLRGVPWRLEVAFGNGVKGCTGYACSTCRFNSRSDPDLFGGALADQPEAGICTHPTCFAAKRQIADKDLAKLTVQGRKFVQKNKAPATESALGGMVAERAVHIRPATVARAVKREMEQAPAATAAPKRPPEDIARDKLSDAERKWNAAAAARLEKAMRKVPGAMLLFSLVRTIQSSPWSAVQPGYNPTSEKVRKATAAVEDVQFQRLLKCLAAPDLQHFIDAEVVSRQQLEGWHLNSVVPEATVALAKTFGVDLDPRPTLEQFLPKTKPTEPEKPDRKSRSAGTK